MLALAALGEVSIDDVPAMLPVAGIHQPDAATVGLYAAGRRRLEAARPIASLHSE